MDDNHWVCGIIYLDKQLIKLYDLLDITKLKDKCNHVAIVIPILYIFWDIMVMTRIINLIHTLRVLFL